MSDYTRIEREYKIIPNGPEQYAVHEHQIYYYMTGFWKWKKEARYETAWGRACAPEFFTIEKAKEWIESDIKFQAAYEAKLMATEKFKAANPPFIYKRENDV